METVSLSRYGLRLEAGQGLQGIARRMGLSYGGVSRRVQPVAGQLTSDRWSRQRVDAALGVKVKTPSIDDPSIERSEVLSVTEPRNPLDRTQGPCPLTETPV